MADKPGEGSGSGPRTTTPPASPTAALGKPSGGGRAGRLWSFAKNHAYGTDARARHVADINAATAAPVTAAAVAAAVREVMGGEGTVPPGGKPPKAVSSPGSESGQQGSALSAYIRLFGDDLRRGQARDPESDTAMQILEVANRPDMITAIEKGEREVRVITVIRDGKEAYEIAPPEATSTQTLKVSLRSPMEECDPKYAKAFAHARKEIARQLRQNGRIDTLDNEDGKGTHAIETREFEIIFSAFVGKAVFPDTQISVWHDWHTNNPGLPAPPDTFLNYMEMTVKAAGMDTPGSFEGTLLADLVKKPTLDPNIGPVRLNLYKHKTKRGVMDASIAETFISDRARFTVFKDSVKAHAQAIASCDRDSVHEIKESKSRSYKLVGLGWMQDLMESGMSEEDARARAKVDLRMLIDGVAHDLRQVTTKEGLDAVLGRLEKYESTVLPPDLLKELKAKIEASKELLKSMPDDDKLKSVEERKKKNAELFADLLSELEGAELPEPVKEELKATMAKVKGLFEKESYEALEKALNDFEQRMRYPLKEVAGRLLEYFKRSPEHLRAGDQPLYERFILQNVYEGITGEVPLSRIKTVWLNFAKAVAWLRDHTVGQVLLAIPAFLWKWGYAKPYFLVENFWDWLRYGKEYRAIRKSYKKDPLKRKALADAKRQARADKATSRWPVRWLKRWWRYTSLKDEMSGADRDLQEARYEWLKSREKTLGGAAWMLTSLYLTIWGGANIYGLAMEKPWLVDPSPVSVRWAWPQVGDWPVHGEVFTRRWKKSIFNPKNTGYRIEGRKASGEAERFLPQNLVKHSDYSLALLFGVGKVLPEEAKPLPGESVPDAKKRAEKAAAARLEWLREGNLQDSPWQKGVSIPAVLTYLYEIRNGSYIADVVQGSEEGKTIFLTRRAERSDGLMLKTEHREAGKEDIYLVDRFVKRLMEESAKGRATTLDYLRNNTYRWYGEGFLWTRLEHKYAQQYGIHRRQNKDFLLVNPVLDDTLRSWLVSGASSYAMVPGSADEVVAHAMERFRKILDSEKVSLVEDPEKRCLEPPEKQTRVEPLSQVEEPRNAAMVLKAFGADAYLENIDKARSAVTALRLAGLDEYLAGLCVANMKEPKDARKAFFTAVRDYLNSERGEMDAVRLLSAISNEEAAKMLRELVVEKAPKPGAKKAEADSANVQWAASATPQDAKTLLAFYGSKGMEDAPAEATSRFFTLARQYLSTAVAAEREADKQAKQPGVPAEEFKRRLQEHQQKSQQAKQALAVLVANAGQARSALLRRVAYDKLAEEALANNWLKKEPKPYESRKRAEAIAAVLGKYRLRTATTAEYAYEHRDVLALLRKLTAKGPDNGFTVRDEKAELFVRDIRKKADEIGARAEDWDPVTSKDRPRMGALATYAITSGYITDWKTKRAEENARLSAEEQEKKVTADRQAETDRKAEVGRLEAQKVDWKKKIAAAKDELKKIEGESCWREKCETRKRDKKIDQEALIEKFERELKRVESKLEDLEGKPITGAEEAKAGEEFWKESPAARKVIEDMVAGAEKDKDVQEAMKSKKVADLKQYFLDHFMEIATSKKPELVKLRAFMKMRVVTEGDVTKIEFPKDIRGVKKVVTNRLVELLKK